MQKKVAEYINQNGGVATVNTPITARPIWKDLGDYLKGIITWEQLKINLGC